MSIRLTAPLISHQHSTDHRARERDPQSAYGEDHGITERWKRCHELKRKREREKPLLSCQSNRIFKWDSDDDEYTSSERASGRERGRDRERERLALSLRCLAAAQKVLIDQYRSLALAKARRWWHILSAQKCCFVCVEKYFCSRSLQKRNLFFCVFASQFYCFCSRRRHLWYSRSVVPSPLISNPIFCCRTTALTGVKCQESQSQMQTMFLSMRVIR